MKKLISSLILAVMLLTMLAVTAFAASGVTITEVQVNEERKVLEIILEAPSTSAYKAADYQITLDSQTLNATDSVRYGESSHGTTWLVVFDRKLTDYNSRIEKLLNSIVSLMGSNDNAAIVYSGDTLSALDNVDTFSSKIKNLPKSDDSIKNYYETVSNMVDYLQYGTDVKDRAVMILISTGTNTDGTGMTRDQAEAKLKASNVVVHTIALHYSLKSGDETKINNFNKLSSNGGTIYKGALTGDSINTDTIVTGIYNAEQKRHVVTCSLEGLSSITDGMLRVSLLGSSPATITLTKEQSAAVNKLVSLQQLPIVTEDPGKAVVNNNETKQEDPTIKVDDNKDLIMYIAIGGIALFCVLLLVLLMRRKPIKAREINVDNLKPNVTPDDPEKQHAGTQVDEDEVAVRVSLKPVNGGEGIHFDQDMRGELRIGRDPGKGGLIIPERDEYRLVSRLHMSLFMQNGTMFIQNESRNGTAVNGTNIGSTPAILHENDRVTIGRVDFIVTWHRIG